MAALGDPSRPSSTSGCDAPAFPQRREDGSISVAACFSTADVSNGSQLLRWVRTWVEDCDRTCGFDVAKDLGAAPRVEPRSDGEVRVVFDADADSTLWKDALVRIATAAERESHGRQALFLDLVAARSHAATP
jgi:hypothetical protein